VRHGDRPELLELVALEGDPQVVALRLEVDPAEARLDPPSPAALFDRDLVCEVPCDAGRQGRRLVRRDSTADSHPRTLTAGIGPLRNSLERSRSLGAIEFLTKPIDADRLLAILAEIEARSS
jgi:hypothetical protein